MERIDRNQGSARNSAAAIGVLIIAFLIIAASYAGLIGIWGDEAFSLVHASKGWSTILSQWDSHLPTYYLLLYPLLKLTGKGENAELVLRILHSVLFSVGLYFCWLIARDLRIRPLLLTLLMVSTIILPNYIFYATNLRMYAALFSASMMFSWLAFRLLRKSVWTARDIGFTMAGGLLLMAVDYPGIILVGVTSIYLIAMRWRLILRRGKSQLLIGIFIAIPAILLFVSGLNKYASWPVLRSMALPESSPRALAKLAFFSLRPILDIVYPPTYAIWVNVLLWLLLLTAIVVSLGVLLGSGNSQERLVVILATYWLVAAPFGVSFTRIFLPAQFFALLAITLALERMLSLQRAWMVTFLFATYLALGVANVQQILHPTLRLYSRIPYREVARDAVILAEARDLRKIAVSRHTLNALSIERYLRPLLRSGQSMIFLDPKPTCASFPHGVFLYIHLMAEDGDASDPIKACNTNGLVRYTVRYVVLKKYVDLNDLDYNSLWQSSLNDKALGSRYAVRIAQVWVSPD
jgi:hypothetical protein